MMNFKKIILLSVPLMLFDNISYGKGSLQNMVDDYRTESEAPAVVLTVKLPDGTEKNYLSGTTLKKTLKNPYPPSISRDNLFQIGSITKSYIAAIILQLESEGKFSINDTVADVTKKYGNWLPDKAYRAWKYITLKQLLNMTSGIFSITEDNEFNTAYLVKNPHKDWKLEEELDFALKHSSYFPPGSGWHYSDTNYMILGFLISKITNRSVEEEVNQRLIKKYDLNNTHYLPYLYPQHILKLMAHGYAYPGDFSPPVTKGKDMLFINMSAANAAGAMISNADDIVKWVDLLLSGKVLPKAQQKELLAAVSIDSKNNCIAGKPLLNKKCEGFSLGLVYINHPKLGSLWCYVGNTAGYYSAFLSAPEKKITLALTVSSSSKNNKKILKTLIQIALLIYMSE